MFDELRCHYPLPVEGANALEFQTKDTPAQYLEHYEIREDGSLWHELYDIEDHSARANWQRSHPGETPPEELDEFCGCMARINKRWEQVENFTGEICFCAYGYPGNPKGWLEFSSYFHSGKLSQLHLIEHRIGS